MKIRILFLTLLMALANITLAQKTEKETAFALDFNDYCVSLIDSLYIYGSAWGEVFGSAYENNNYSKLTTYADKILSFIEKSQKGLIKRKVNPDMEDLKIVVLDFLSFEKSMIEEAFRPFEKFNDKTSEETVLAQVDILTERASKEEEVLKTVRLEQVRLGELYGYKIED